MTVENTEEDVVRGAAGMPEPPAPAGAPVLDDIEEAMRDVVDPELGINVVDLGLVYGIAVDDRIATIDMTLTSAACPLTDVTVAELKLEAFRPADAATAVLLAETPAARGDPSWSVGPR